MKIREVNENEKERFNQVSTHPLQSWEWGEFRKNWGNEVVRLGAYEDDKLQQSLQLTLHKIPGTNKKIGMLIKGSEPKNEILDRLKVFAKKNDLIFIKLEPNQPVIIRHPELDSGSKETDPSTSLRMSKGQILDQVRNDKKKVIKTLKENGAVPGKTLFTPTTFWIDLTQNEEDMMKDFHSKTRYNIRYARKKGVEVVEDNSDRAFDTYLSLMRKTVERQGFYAHTEKYHRLMWKHLHHTPPTTHQSSIARLLTAKYKGEILTAWIVFVWKDFLYYPYGAASMKKKNLQANSLMMWEAILYGKKLGLKTFDLWGREPGKGFTKFKEGFNPHVVEFPGTWDLPVSPLYYPFRAADYLRWKYLRLKGKAGLTKHSF